MKYFLQGLTMGLAYVAPIGLQNLFVINSALTHTRKRALLTALIVIFFDVTLALACFFGVGAVMQRYEWLQMVILLLGSLIVLYIGVGLLRAKAEEYVRKTVSESAVVAQANAQANEIIADAENQAAQLRLSVQQYCESRLNDLETSMAQALNEIQVLHQRFEEAGRSMR